MDYKNTPEGRAVQSKYGKILHASRPEPPHDHPRMPMSNRAKIFSPFAALRGYEDEVPFRTAFFPNFFLRPSIALCSFFSFSSLVVSVNRSTWKKPSSLTTRLAAIVIRLTVRVLSAILSNSSVVAETRILPRLVGLSSFVLP